MLDDIPAGCECVVVTDDGELAVDVRNRGGTLMSAAEFAGVLGRRKDCPRADHPGDGKSSLSAEEEKRITADLKRAWGIR